LKLSCKAAVFAYIRHIVLYAGGSICISIFFILNLVELKEMKADEVRVGETGMNAIVNGKIIMENSLVKDKAIIFEDKIIDIVPENEISRYNINNLIDAQGYYVSPGFIDIHIHGAWGYDTMDGNSRGLQFVAESLVSHGVTAFLPTTMTMDRKRIENALLSIERAKEKVPGAKILGCHLEGPFISPQYAGAQDPSYTSEPDFGLIERYIKLIKIVTIAPELQNACSFIKQCTEKGIVASIGHSRGSYEDVISAFEYGARSVTHIFNAMTPLNHRAPGIAGAALSSSEVYCELIADNIHVHPVVQRIVLQSKGIEKVILVSDSMRACGLGEGTYELGGRQVIVANNSARLADGTLAGSILTIDNALRNFRANTGLSVAEAVRTVTENPAKLLQLDDTIGSIGIGKSADFVIHDDDFSIVHTFVDGKQHY